ncbi:uncharacterized protein C2845_PM12G21120 [Panicum miliaceum]|uniref:Lunapark zinc ribbon domain-containing protein n=1 Tax=Panicum miliaceum TaxID=4540 RepID=A0A3L6QE38_PANMI|nr:uncharacterized protein C2845_PM12G21120 [Panicum miliaceum]
MALSSAAADEVAPAPAPAEAAEAKGKGKRGGVLGRMWRALFGGREDFEKRLQYLSKEEAAVHARMRRRMQFSRRAVRNLIVLSVLAEVLAVVYAIMMTRDEGLTWQMRAIRVLPMFVLPAVSSLIYSTVVNFTRMLERKDQKTLEKLRAERKAKIDELKERTNYYLTQQLIQKYDLDPAAKAAAASVLASKLGEETGLKLHVGEEPKLDAAVARSNDVEILPSDGLRNRRQPNARGSRTGSPSAAHTPAQGTESSPTASAGLETAPALMVVEHHQGTGANDGGWIAKIAALLVGEDPSQSYALICGNCHMHNGLARKEDYPHSVSQDYLLRDKMTLKLKGYVTEACKQLSYDVEAALARWGSLFFSRQLVCLPAVRRQTNGLIAGQPVQWCHCFIGLRFCVIGLLGVFGQPCSVARVQGWIERRCMPVCVDCGWCGAQECNARRNIVASTSMGAGEYLSPVTHLLITTISIYRSKCWNTVIYSSAYAENLKEMISIAVHQRYTSPASKPRGLLTYIGTRL